MSSTYKFFSEKAYEAIIKIIEDRKYDKALLWYQQYLERYPNDGLGHVSYADLLIKLGRFDEANDIMNQYETKLKIDTIKDYNIIKLKLLCCLEKYEEAYNLILNNEKYLMDKKEEVLLVKKKLGLLTEEDYKIYSDSYTAQQIIDYNEKQLFNHIKKHLYDDETPTQSKFVENFPIEDTVEKIKQLLPSQTKIYNSIITTLYIFEYRNCGVSDNMPADYIEVVAIDNGKQILTMYPYLNKEKRKGYDITPTFINNSKEEPKVKRLSQIEKFNQKYSKQ